MIILLLMSLLLCILNANLKQIQVCLHITVNNK